MASVNRTSESRRRQALPAVLAMVVGALAGGLVPRPVVWCLDQWFGARTGGLVLGTVVWCSKVVWCAMAAASTAMRTLVRYGLRWGVTVISVSAWVHVFQVAEARHWPTCF